MVLIMIHLFIDWYILLALLPHPRSTTTTKTWLNILSFVWIQQVNQVSYIHLTALQPMENFPVNYFDLTRRNLLRAADVVLFKCLMRQTQEEEDAWDPPPGVSLIKAKHWSFSHCSNKAPQVSRRSAMHNIRSRKTETSSSLETSTGIGSYSWMQK